MNRILALLTLMTATPCFAQTGADALLNQLGEKSGGQVPQLQIPLFRQITGDLFQQQLGIQSQNHPKLTLEVRQWAFLIVDNEFEKAAHLWTLISQQIPEDFRFQADAAQLYVLWKLGLGQTFFDQWVKTLANPEYAKSIPELTLETLIAPQLDAFLVREGVTVSATSLETLEKLTDKKPVFVTLRALASIRRPKLAEEVLPLLTPENKLARFVSGTVLFDHVRNGDLKGAAHIMKNFYEPAIEKTRDPELLAKHNLAIGRILFQAGQLDAAAQFYKKIPNQSPSFLPGHEELAWVYLKSGDIANLRGELKALTSPLYKDRFMPEAFLVRAISDLKMCYYDQLDKDLVEFTANNRNWAIKIDQALNATPAPAPAVSDEYTRMGEHSSRKLDAEVKRLENYAKASAGSGPEPQAHWKEYLTSAQTQFAAVNQRLDSDRVRQWKNMQVALQEAIRKMRFVKVEYMSQVRLLSSSTANEAKSKTLLAAHAPAAKDAGILEDVSDKLVFPASKEIWADEVFRLKSSAQVKCVKKTTVQ